MRIISGRLRGRKLVAPDSKELRPTSDAAREALFNILRERVVGCRFLDVCAGVGTVGLEALSRGATRATFIERDAACIAALKRNIAKCGCEQMAKVIRSDALLALKRLVKLGEKFDIIFADPPYEGRLALKLLQLVSENTGLLADSGLVIIQHSERQHLPVECGQLKLLKRHRVGENAFSFYTLRKDS
ncbi:MAG: 16S rRNA (guanine(966)-N(2))-methyltransferase RsmD [Armatimonadota bacterium]|nr:16S rRNA (guanine(966)-N(2))-methyltransferase RsmD [Armatimonadota bacterium]MCX7777302.1 16S rRNA (guanine(966)-N(2))-methyltransferase RsmD [Armatimonadota bacterium]MDW8024381.1 16S rRNA (guanine(966)-N(2))-methyltransferase RsmD [Armatimonadota bacterium]